MRRRREKTHTDRTEPQERKGFDAPSDNNRISVTQGCDTSIPDEVRTCEGMTTYDERNKLASRADAVFGTGEAQTLMDMLSTGERLEIEIVKLRAEMDQRFARMDQQFVDLQRNILEAFDEKLTKAQQFNRGTVWAAVATMAASVLAAGISIALAVAFG